MCDTGPVGSETEPRAASTNMSDPSRFTIIDAEVSAASGGVDDATGQPVVVLTLRPIINSGWKQANYSLHPDNARSLLDRLTCVVVGMARV